MIHMQCGIVRFKFCSAIEQIQCRLKIPRPVRDDCKTMKRVDAARIDRQRRAEFLLGFARVAGLQQLPALLCRQRRIGRVFMPENQRAMWSAATYAPGTAGCTRCQ